MNKEEFLKFLGEAKQIDNYLYAAAEDYMKRILKPIHGYSMGMDDCYIDFSIEDGAWEFHLVWGDKYDEEWFVIPHDFFIDPDAHVAKVYEENKERLEKEKKWKKEEAARRKKYIREAELETLRKLKEKYE